MQHNENLKWLKYNLIILFQRCLDEREAKLKALTTNIQQSIAKSTPVRQTKLAYVDSVAKPPRNVARQQVCINTSLLVL